MAGQPTFAVHISLTLRPKSVYSNLAEELLIKQILQTYPRRELSAPERRLAAVLVPLYQHNGDYGVIFTQRSDAVLYHRGQISFPGGGHEVHDVSLQHTALRE